MKHIVSLFGAAALILTGVAAYATDMGAAPQGAGLRITDVRIVEPAVLDRPTWLFLTIDNKGDTADTLLDAKSQLCGRTELHNMTMDNGVMAMRKIDGVDIPAGQKTELKPKSLHVMCFDPKPMKAQDHFSLTLNFKGAGTIETADGVVVTPAEAFGTPEPAKDAGLGGSDNADGMAMPDHMGMSHPALGGDAEDETTAPAVDSHAGH